MHFTLADRELTQNAKKRSMFILRTLVGAAALVVLLFVAAMDDMSGGSSFGALQFAGVVLANLALYAQLFVVFVLAPLATSGLVAKEKQEHTLGLLVLADMGGADIFLSKLLSGFLYAELLVISVLPVTAIASIFGGVSVPGIAIRTALLSLAALAMCTTGLLCSTLSRRPAEAFLSTILFEAVWLTGTGVLDLLTGLGILDSSVIFLPPDPTTNILLAAFDVGSSTSWLPPPSVLPAIIITLAIIIVSSLLTIRLIPGQAVARTAKKLSQRRLARRKKRQASARPLVNLVSSCAPGLAVYDWPAWKRLAVAIGMIPVVVMPCVGHILLVALICYDITSSLATARETGDFDRVFLTPVSNQELTHSLFIAYLRRSALFFPAVACMGLLGAAQVLLLSLTDMLANASLAGGVFAVLLALAYLVLVGCITPLVTLGLYVAAGCWATGQSTKTPRGQTIIAVITVVAIQIGMGAVVGIPSSVLMNMSFSNSGFSTMISQGLMLAVTTGISVFIAYGFLKGFANSFETERIFRVPMPTQRTYVQG